MPKRRKVEEESDASDEEVVTDKKAEKKPATKKPATAGVDNLTVCELSKNRKVNVRKFKGQIFVDIREFFEKNGEELPGKKGISLSLEQWEVLKKHFDGIQKLIDVLS